jgi:hypothetical protein
MCTSKFHYNRAYESERKLKLKEIKNEIKFREGIIEKYEQEIEYQNQKIITSLRDGVTAQMCISLVILTRWVLEM